MTTSTAAWKTLQDYEQSRECVRMMPHPERAVEDLLGSEDGKRFFASILKTSER